MLPMLSSTSPHTSASGPAWSLLSRSYCLQAWSFEKGTLRFTILSCILFVHLKRFWRASLISLYSEATKSHSTSSLNFLWRYTSIVLIQGWQKFAWNYGHCHELRLVNYMNKIFNDHSYTMYLVDESHQWTWSTEVDGKRGCHRRNPSIQEDFDIFHIAQ